MFLLQKARKSGIIKLTQIKGVAQSVKTIRSYRRVAGSIKTYLGNSPKQTGRPQSDNRKLLNGVLWILHTGAPWRDLPEYYGPWQTVYKRFAQWQKNDKFKQLFENVRENPDMQDLCIDGTYIKAHRASAGAKKGLRDMMIISVLGSVEEEDPPKSMQ